MSVPELHSPAAGTNVFDLIRDWAEKKDLHCAERALPQTVKLMEEVGELARHVVREDKYSLQDAIGDCVVVLTILAQGQGLDIEDCIEAAWEEIADRKGVTVNGFFVKEG